MKRRSFLCILLICVLIIPVGAEPIKWVDFGVPYESLKYAMEQDIATVDQEKHIGWVESLSLAACRTGGKCGLSSVKKAVSDLKTGKSIEDLLGDLMKYYDYYHESYSAALGGAFGKLRY